MLQLSRNSPLPVLAVALSRLRLVCNRKLWGRDSFLCDPKSVYGDDRSEEQGMSHG